MFGKTKKKKNTFKSVRAGEYSLQAASLKDGKAVKAIILEAAKTQPSLVGLSYTELKKGDDGAWADWIESFAKDSRSILALLYHNNETVVGFLMIEPDTKGRYSHTAVLTPMYVKKEHRDADLEQELLSGVLTHLQKNAGIKKVRMCLTPDNSTEFPIYGAVGFVRFGYDEKHLKVGKKFYDCILLVKTF
jgi:L-amino acid N-acyltransferase YncA